MKCYSDRTSERRSGNYFAKPEHLCENPKLFYQNAKDRSWWTIFYSWAGLPSFLWRPMLIWLVLWGLVEIYMQTVPIDPNDPDYKEKIRGFHQTKVRGNYLVAFMDIMEEAKPRMITMTVFLLGFYVSVIYNRWWSLYTSIPWPDDIAMTLRAAYPKEEDTELRNTAIRYMLLAQALSFMWISPEFLKKYPNLQSLIDSGLLTNEERDCLNSCFLEDVNDCSYWTPYLWFQNLVLSSEKSLPSEPVLYKLLQDAKSYMGGLGSLFVISDVTVPLTYCQAITYMVWSLYVFTIFTRHTHESLNRREPYYVPVPIFAMLVNCVTLGLLKSAMIMAYPLGSNTGDESFELLEYFERNVKIVKIMLDGPLPKQARGLNREDYNTYFPPRNDFDTEKKL